MNRFAVIFAAAIACAGANSAWAADGDEQLVTASRTAKSPVAVLSTAAATASPATDSVQPLAVKDANAVSAYDAVAAAGPRPDLSLIHGSAGVSIGTGGYRSAFVSAVMPVGNDGMLAIAVKQTDYGKNGAMFDYDGYGYGQGYGMGYGAGYGYGYDGGYGRGYGYGRRGLMSRGGKQTSVAVALDMGDGEASSITPAGCAPGFRDGDGRYVEPVWVTKLHDKRKCDAASTDASR